MRKYIGIAFLLLPFFCNGQSSLGIVPNPVFDIETNYTTDQMVLKDVSDTSIQDIHIYTPIQKGHYPAHYLSNLGHAYKSLVINDWRQIGFDPGFHQTDRYFFFSDKVRYYSTKTPFTQLTYSFGQKNENYFDASHSQNITKEINLTLDYRRLNSDGIFAQNATSCNTLSLGGWYSSKNGRYDVFANFLLNNYKIQESGGWALDNVFKDAAYKRDKSIIPVKLQEDAQNLWKQKEVHFKQYFNPFKNTFSDTTVAKDFKAARYFTHDFTWQKNNLIYTDQEEDSTFYYDYFIDSTATEDRTNYSKIGNRFSFFAQNDTAANLHFEYLAFVAYEFYKYRQNTLSENVHQVFLGSEIKTAFLDNRLSTALSGQVALTPKYFGDFLITTNNTFQLKDTNSIAFGAVIKLSSPTYREEHFMSNHYRWNNDFKKIFTTTLFASWEQPKWLLSTEVRTHLIQHFIYYDTISQPHQYDAPIWQIQLQARKDFDWRMFHLGIMGVVQYNTGKEVLRLPNFWGRTTLYYQGGFIKGKLHAQLGFDVTYNTNYRGDAYNPALMSFYLQDKEKLTFYPVLDVFFNIHIKRARLFFLYQHVNSGMFQGGYYTAPDYAMPDRNIKTGVVWQFFD
ncbi:MAG: putative porin [Chitinophagales bacterium]|nr:putative porin [Chitinophagales bacterium]